jgi:hypothetical protein
MKYATEMGSAVMLCIPSFIKIQKLMGVLTDTDWMVIS